MKQPGVQAKAGYRKMQLCMNQAIKDGLAACWVDTCCINKESSAELSEAINSMYKWYKDARVCYAYLDDVSVGEGYQLFDSPRITFEHSTWFTRGWTLQELLAPRALTFYDRDWNTIGTRYHKCWEIEKHTGIPWSGLRGRLDLSEYSVAQRMSWAARRETTRPEDRAYSLLGLFDVNMPMLYGEGRKAFQRLQEEIFRKSTDHSIFCWTMRTTSRTWDTMGGYLFADSPLNFDSHATIATHKGPEAAALTSYQLTNLGLDAHMPLLC